jgi:hypothetical protein
VARTERRNWMSDFLGEEAEAQCRILAKLRGRLERGQDAADPRSTAPPSRDWVRAMAMYLDGYRVLAQLELEHAKVRILADRAGHKPPMTDEEFQARLEELGRQAIGALSAEELEAELARKRALVVVDVPADR